MSIGDFKSLIKNRFYDKQLLTDALDIWRNCKEFKDVNFKDEFPLERYTSCPMIFCHDVISNFVNFAKEKYEVPSSKTDYGIVKETEKWILINPVNPNSFKYMAHKFLRQKGDEKEFGFGPRWCIASSSRESYWNTYCKTTPSPLSYILFSKTDSLKRVAIVFDKIANVNGIKNFSYKDELIQRLEIGDSIEELSNEVRLMENSDSHPAEALDYIEKNFGITEDIIEDAIFDYLVKDFDKIVDGKNEEKTPHFKEIFERYEQVIKEYSDNLYEIFSRQYKNYGLEFKDIPWTNIIKDVHNGEYSSSTYTNLFELLTEKTQFRNDDYSHQIFYEELLCMLCGIGKIKTEKFINRYIHNKVLNDVESKANTIIRNKKLEQLAQISRIKKTTSSINLKQYLKNISNHPDYPIIGKIIKDIVENISFSDEKYTPSDFYREFKNLKYEEEWDGYGRFENTDPTVKRFINTVVSICPQKEEFFYKDILNDFSKTIGSFFNDGTTTLEIISTWWGVLGYDFDLKRVSDWAENILKTKIISNDYSLKISLLSIVYLYHLRKYSGEELCQKYIELKKYLKDDTNRAPFSGDFRNIMSHYTDIYEKNETILKNIEKIQKEEFLKNASEDIENVAKSFISKIKKEKSQESFISRIDWKNNLRYWSREMNGDFGLTRKYETEKNCVSYFVSEIFKIVGDYFKNDEDLNLKDLLEEYSNENFTWSIEEQMFGWNY